MKIPDKYEKVVTLAEDAADGAHSHEATIGLLQNTEAAILADLAAAQAAESAFQAARANKKALTTAQTLADSNAKFFIGATRKVLSLTLGDQWNAQWAAVGWNDPSLQVPETLAGRLAILPAIAVYLTANPTKENGAAAITAAAATARHTAFSDARGAVHQGNTTAGTVRAVRDTAVEKLRQRLISLVGELTLLLDDDDPRWDAFGLSRPGDLKKPGIPDALILTGGIPGTVLADWADARRATRYKVEIQIVGNPTGFAQVADVEDSDATLSDLPSGATVKVRILAANSTGDSAPSEEAQIVVP